jgi:hypothetical protein
VSVTQSFLKKHTGWIPEEFRDYAVQKSVSEQLERAPLFFGAAPTLKGTGEKAVALLHLPLAKAFGGTFPVNFQKIGDCVSQGYAKAVEVERAVQFAAGATDIVPDVLVATEWIYYTSRVLQGGGRLGNEDGSLGAWAAPAVVQHGILFRRDYGSHDLREYDFKRAKAWGYKSGPPDMEKIADETPVGKTALITSYAEARDAIANGHPIAVCSTQGFKETRDQDGFAAPSGEWAHCMVIVAVDDEFKRPGVLCVNSWGTDWITGPKRHDQPEGSFWIDADVFDRMCRHRDTFAIAGSKGFKRRDVYNFITAA